MTENAGSVMTDYGRARIEHVDILRREGMTYRAIGARLGVTKVRARQMLARLKETD